MTKLSNLARLKNPVEPKDVIKNWMRSKNTLEYLGLWERLNNPDFKGVEFDPFLKGNIRDYASINQLICLSNMENLNAAFINDGLPQSERLERLNQIAIQQMEVLENIENRKLLIEKKE